MTKWRAALIGLVLGVSITSGCAAPTLPIPPPTALVSSPDASGMVTIDGHADPSAYVFVLHEITQDGVITHATAMGTFSVRLPGAIGDDFTVWQMIGNQQSQQLMLTVH